MRVEDTEKKIMYYREKYHMERYLNKELLSELRLYSYPAFTNIYHEEDEQPNLLFLVEGEAKGTHYLMNGKEVVIAVMTPFMVLGDFEVFTDAPIHNDVITTKDSVMLGIPIDIVYQYGSDDPKLLKFLLNQLQEKFSSKALLQKGSVLTVKGKLALYMFNDLNDDESSEVVLPGKEALASFLGTTQRHLNRVLKDFVDGRLITGTYPRIQILDKEVLLGLIEN